MGNIDLGEPPFSTSDVILAIALFSAGCEPVDEAQPCTNLFDPDILGELGYRGERLMEAAEAAWANEEKGHVQFHLKLSARALELIKAFRDQSELVKKGEGKSFDMLAQIAADARAGAMQDDEMILRFACVILKTRGELANLWKKMIPLLRFPVDGTVKHFDSTAVSNGKTVEAKGVQRPGFKVISLNVSEATRKHLGL